MLGILYGLSAAFWWGTSDFLAARVSKRAGALRALLVTQSLGLIAIAALLWVQGQVLPAPGRAWLLIFCIGCAQAICVFLFYRAFEIGKLSLVAPITSGFAVVTALLALVSGERPPRLALLGAAILVLGVVFISRGHTDAEPGEGGLAQNNLRGIPEAICAALGYGFIFWGMDFVVPEMGPLWPLAILRVVSLLFLSAALLLRRVPSPVPWNWRWILLPAVGVASCDTLAWLSFNSGTQHGDVAIVTALSSLYSAVAVFFAWLIWRERLARAQWLGVGLVLMGVLLVGVK